MTANRLSCTLCIFFQDAPQQGPVDLKRAAVRHGICRRFPPTVTMTPGGMMAMFPQTDQSHWCGEILRSSDTDAQLAAEDAAEDAAAAAAAGEPTLQDRLDAGAVSHWPDGSPRR
jgi:hypothetical protein